MAAISPPDDPLQLVGDYRRRISTELQITPKRGGLRIHLDPNAIQGEYLDETCYSPWLHDATGEGIMPVSPWSKQPFQFRNLILKPRQVGMSTIVLAKKVMRIATEPNRNLLIIAQDDAFKQEFRERVHAYLADIKNAGLCPPFGTAAGRGKADNIERLDFAHNSTIYFQSAQSPNIGRTNTYHDAYGTEIAFWDIFGEGRARKIVHALNSAVPDPPYGEIDFESTPNGPAGAFFDLCMAAIEGKITEVGGGKAWRLFFWPWWKQQEYRIDNPGIHPRDLNDHEKWLYREHGCDMGQLEWRRIKIAEAEAVKQHFDSEYPEDPLTCFITAQQTVLKKPTISRMRAIVTAYDPIETEFDGDLRIYEGPQTGIEYILGADGAQGNEGDDESAFVLARKDSMAPVVCYNGYLPPHDFAKLIARIAYTYNKAYVGAEANNDVGYAVNKALDDLNYPNLHYRQDPEMDVRSGVKINPFKLGWRTDVKTRPEMVSEYQDWHNGNLVLIRDKTLVNQSATMIWRPPKGNPSGRKQARAAPSAKDDLVLAWMICLQLRSYASSVDRKVVAVRH